ncbi:MAG: hypothetical protein ACLS9K_14545 [Lachnospira eligens]
MRDRKHLSDYGCDAWVSIQEQSRCGWMSIARIMWNIKKMAIPYSVDRKYRFHPRKAR